MSKYEDQAAHLAGVKKEPMLEKNQSTCSSDTTHISISYSNKLIRILGVSKSGTGMQTRSHCWMAIDATVNMDCPRSQ